VFVIRGNFDEFHGAEDEVVDGWGRAPCEIRLYRTSTIVTDESAPTNSMDEGPVEYIWRTGLRHTDLQQQQQL
jgi:hypothetical protein